MTRVQNGPELQLQVRLNVFRADAISPLPTSRLVQLDPPTELILSAKEPPGAALGLGRAGRPREHLLAPSGCSPELLASGAEVFLHDASQGCTGRAQRLCAPLEQPGCSGGKHSTASPLTHGRGARFSPPACVSCPHPSACMGCGNMREGPPHCKLGWTVAEHGEGAGCWSVTWAGEEHCLPHPRAIHHRTAGLSSTPASPHLQHGTDWSPATSRHYERHPDTQT